MRRMRRTMTGYFLATGLVISSCFTVAQGFNGLNPTPSVAKESSEPILSTTEGSNSGILAWLESFLPDGIRFLGPATGSQNQAETLATANCFNSGAGLSCNGFASLQEYLTAVRVSENLGIPIQKLQQKLQSGRTLHQAIQELRPGLNGQLEALRAEQQARKMLRGFSS